MLYFNFITIGLLIPVSSGGDQNAYMTYWADTEVQTIIQSKLENITIGGTSAGLAVLGNWVYTAEDGTVYSDEALKVSNVSLKLEWLNGLFIKLGFCE